MVAAGPPSDDELTDAARRLGAALLRRGERLATAESATGGLIGHLITQAAGSSDYYAGGVVAYANDAKESLLGVSAERFTSVGAVSSEVAGDMATGVLERLAADVAVAVTGIAGPAGGSSAKPVGLTYVAAVRRSGRPAVETHVWPHDRDGNKRASALAALRLAESVTTDDRG